VQGTTESVASDASLIVRAEAGDDASFDELHRRHVLAAWGLAQAITRDDVTALAAVRKAIPAVFAAIARGSYPPGLPVRSAVLAATRVAAVAMLHSSTWTGRPQRRDLVDRAFSGLPECWRSALWLTEVERLRPLEAAHPLRIPPDDVAGLVGRARDGFTDRYMRLAAAGRSPECRATLPLLSGLMTKTLTPWEVAAVDQHLAGCRPCRNSSADLSCLAAALRGIALPTPLLTVAATAPPRRPPRVDRPPRPERPRLVPALAAAIVAVLGLASGAALSRDTANSVQQAASPIEADQSVREPERVRSLAASPAAPADVVAPPAGLTSAPRGARAHGGVAAAASARSPAVPAHLPVAAPLPAEDDGSSDGVAPPPAPVERDRSDPVADPAAGPPTEPQPKTDAGQEPEGIPPSSETTVGVDVAGVTVTATVDPDAPEPVMVEVTIPGPSTGLVS
jgi:hypothetical protein